MTRCRGRCAKSSNRKPDRVGEPDQQRLAESGYVPTPGMICQSAVVQLLCHPQCQERRMNCTNRYRGPDTRRVLMAIKSRTRTRKRRQTQRTNRSDKATSAHRTRSRRSAGTTRSTSTRSRRTSRATHKAKPRTTRAGSRVKRTKTYAPSERTARLLAQSEGLTHTTTDHDEIRHWAEQRGARPARVKSASHRQGHAGMIGLQFPGFPVDELLQPISWDEFFAEFEKNKLALTYQETTVGGLKSNFNKLVTRKGM